MGSRAQWVEGSGIVAAAAQVTAAAQIQSLAQKLPSTMSAVTKFKNLKI